jgi:hypothetical protein
LERDNRNNTEVFLPIFIQDLGFIDVYLPKIENPLKIGGKLIDGANNLLNKEVLKGSLG